VFVVSGAQRKLPWRHYVVHLYAVEVPVKTFFSRLQLVARIVGRRVFQYSEFTRIINFLYNQNLLQAIPAYASDSVEV